MEGGPQGPEEVKLHGRWAASGQVIGNGEWVGLNFLHLEVCAGLINTFAKEVATLDRWGLGEDKAQGPGPTGS